MANSKSANGTSKMTTTELREWYEKNKSNLENFDMAKDAMRLLRDATKSTRQRNVSEVTVENLRKFLKAPSSNEKNLRDLSRYLYYRSQIYYRIVKYLSNMFDLRARSIIPAYNLVKDNDKDKMRKSYNETLQVIDNANLQYEFLKIYTQCWRDDLFVGCAYWDDESLFILPLDLDYCKINGVFKDGSFSAVMDMTFFNKYKELLEYWGAPFDQMYKDYERENQKWQPIPEEYCVCLKARAEDWETVIPPLVGIFEALLRLCNLEDVQAIADEEQIYKLLVATIPTISGTNQPDDWAVNPKLAVEYFNKIVDRLPEYTDAVISPIPIEQISFSDDTATDVNKVEKATEAVLNTSGGAQILNAAKISGSTAFNAAIRSDSEYAISMLLPQTELVVNRLLSFVVKNHAKVKFFETSVYLEQELRKNLLESAQYGLPTKIALNTLNGFSELDTLALNFLEEEILGITEKFVPLQSSYTQSGNDQGGRPTKDDDEIGDDGDASRTKRDRAN